METTINRAPRVSAEPPINVGPLKRSGGSKVVKGSLAAVSAGIGIVSLVGIIPGIGQIAQVPLMAAAHLVDRVRYGIDAGDELKHRAEYYSPQIFKQLNIQPVNGRKATVAEFKKAAESAKRQGNPELDRLYSAPILQRNKANNESLLTNGGIALAGAVVPAGGIVAGVASAGKVGLEAGHVAKIVGGTVRAAKSMLPTMAGGLAGGALANVLSRKQMDSQNLVEAIHSTVADAEKKGIDPRQVITPNMLFLLRIEQDKKLAEEIKQKFGDGKKSFHEMDEGEQARVMSAYPVLANSATSDAELVATGTDIRELATQRANLSGTEKYVVGEERSSFAQRELARRAAAPKAAAQAGPAGGYANMVQQRRAAQLTNGGIV